MSECKTDPSLGVARRAASNTLHWFEGLDCSDLAPVITPYQWLIVEFTQFCKTKRALMECPLTS